MKIVVVFLLCLISLALSQQCMPQPLCADITCGTPLPPLTRNNTACKTCTVEDIGSRFTECERGVKSLIYYWKPPATCVPSGAVTTLPNPISNINCNVRCAVGEFFNTTTLQCQRCAAGSYASNGIRVFDEWSRLPSRFTTRCETDIPNQPCRSWRPAGTFIDSGRNDYLFNLRSILEYTTSVSEPGSITFEYRYSTDNPIERFSFSANSFQILFDVTNGTYRTYTLSLSPGTYTFQWMITRKTLTYRDNLARIRRIAVSGLSTVDTFCPVCPAGFISNGTTSCRPCQRGFVSSNPGSSVCTRCPPNFSSHPGDSACYELPHFICQASDWYNEVSNCVNGRRTVTPTWIAPKVCLSNDNRSLPLPAPYTIACPTASECLPNQILDSNGNCVYCPVNSRRASPTSCEACPVGTGTRNTFVLDTFYNQTMRDMGFQTGCFGECSSRGWRFAGTYVGSGIGNGLAVTWLRVPVFPARGVLSTDIALEYTLSCPIDGGEFLVFTQLTNPLYTIPCGGCTNQRATVNLTLPSSEAASTGFIFLAYRSFTAETEQIDCDRILIHKMTLTNSQLGGSDTCFGCPPGTNGNSNCESCPPGTFSNAERNCASCAANTFSYESSEFCAACPFGMNSTANSSFCSWVGEPAVVNVPLLGVTKTFRYASLANFINNRAYFLPNDGSTRFYLNLLGIQSTFCGRSLFCQVDSTGAVHSLGDTSTVNAFATADAMGLSLQMTSMKRNCLVNGTLSLSTSTVSLSCDPSATQTTVQIFRFSNPCITNAVVTSRDVCPSCLESDFTLYKGACIDNVRDVKWMKKPGPAHYCVGGEQKNLTMSTESCILEFTVSVQWWHVILGIGIPILVIAVVAGLIVVAIVLVKRYRNLNTRFHALEADDQSMMGSDGVRSDDQ